MEFFNNARAVRLKSHLDKYLIADDNEETVHQSRDGASRKARWEVEFVGENPHVIRLRGCHGRYLTASDESFLLGWTGKKVLQTVPDTKRDVSVEWEPIKEGYRVKLRTKGGKFLRANGATLPWRNSVTHDLPNRTATQDWVLWDVEVVDISVLDDQYLPSHGSSLSSIRDGFEGSNSPSVRESGSRPVPEKSFPSSRDGLEGSNSPSVRESGSRPAPEKSFPSSRDGLEGSNSPSVRESGSRPASEKRRPLSISESHDRRSSMGSDRSLIRSGRTDGMEFFAKAKAVRLQSHLGKYLVADDDEETVRQSRKGASRNARWTIEFVDGKRGKIRLKSFHGRYLTASEKPFLLGMTGKKVLQTLPEKKTDVSIEWEPVKEGFHVKLMTNEGKFLRANGGAPPWKNSVTHDVPHRTATQNWVLWGVEIVDIVVVDSDADADSGSLSPASSFSSQTADDFSGSPDTGSPVVQYSAKPRRLSMKAAPSRSENISMTRV